LLLTHYDNPSIGSAALGAGDKSFRLTTLDAALLSLEYKTAFPNPVHKVLSSIHKDS